MLHSTFILSLLASAASAQGLSLSVGLPALPSFALVAPGATIDPISSRVSTVTPTPTSTPIKTPVDDDQPDPYNSSVQLPASESFNPSKAPAFTQVPNMPNISIGPVFSSEPCSTEVTVTKSTPALSAAPPAQTPSESEPCSEDTPSPSTTGTPLPISPSTIPTGGPPPPPVQSEFPTFIPRPSVISAISPSSIPTGGPPPPPVLSGFPTFVPRPSTTLAVSSSAAPRPAYPMGGVFPTFIPRPSDRPAYGAGRPRPTGAWPSRARPSHAHIRPHRQSPGVPRPAAETPCTLETRVRPRATEAVQRV